MGKILPWDFTKYLKVVQVTNHPAKRGKNQLRKTTSLNYVINDRTT